MIPRDILDVRGDGVRRAVGDIAVHVQPVGALLERDEPAELGLARDVILRALRCGAERAADQLTFFVEGVGQAIHCALAGVHLAGGLVEVVEVGLAVRGDDGLPAGLLHAHARVVVRAAGLEDAGQLAAAGAVLAEIIPERALFAVLIAGEILRSGELRAAVVIRPHALLIDPAVPALAVQTILIFKVDRLVGIAGEVRTVVERDVLAVVVREETVLHLILFLRSQILQNVEVRVNVVIQFAGNLHIELIGLLSVPRRLIGGRELHTAEHTERVCRSRINRLSLQKEIGDDLNCIAVNLSRSQIKVLVDQLQAGDIRFHTVGNVNRDRNGRKRADALSQLEQEVPSSAPLLIAAGQHVEQTCQLLRDRHLGHINRESVARDHRFARDLLIIHINLTLVAGVGHVALPVQQILTAGLLIKIEGRLVRVIEIDLETRCVLQSLVNGRFLRNQLCLRTLKAIGNRLLISRHELLIDQGLELVQLVLLNRAECQRAHPA